MSKKVYISVINDLSHDQRVHKVCTSLYQEGYDVNLIGRLLPDSSPLEREYKTHRMKLLFKKGAMFYATYNIRLFLYLLFRRADVYHANDLDTLLANRIVSRLKRKPLIYDSHEYFTGVPEIQNRPKVKKVWTKIEQSIFPKLKYIFTVNDSIANLYQKEYGKHLKVIRNIPSSKLINQNLTRNDLPFDISENEKLLVIQGAGINIDRGTEELLEAMVHLDHYKLMIIGSGDVIESLKSRAANGDLNNKVFFLGKLPYQEMMQYTQLADAGITLDKPTNINYLYSLPNKLFDYIRAGIPVIASDLIEIKKVITKYNIGAITPGHNPLMIAETITTFFQNTDISQIKDRIDNASKQLSWENEVISMLEVYRNLS